MDIVGSGIPFDLYYLCFHTSVHGPVYAQFEESVLKDADGFSHGEAEPASLRGWNPQDEDALKGYQTLSLCSRFVTF